MAKYTKKELAELAKLNEAEIGELVRRGAKTFWRWKKKATAYEQAMLRARDEFLRDNPETPESLKADFEEIQRQIIGWLVANPPADGKPRHIDFPYGRIGVRENPVAVKRTKGVSDEMVLESMEELALVQQQANALHNCDERLAAIGRSVFFRAIQDELARRQLAAEGGTTTTVTDADVLAAFDALPDFGAFLRRDVSLNKELLRDYRTDVEFVVARIGIEFAKDETFYVEPKAESEIHEI